MRKEATPGSTTRSYSSTAPWTKNDLIEPVLLIRAVLTPVGGDGDIFIGDSSLSRDSFEDSGTRSGVVPDVCMWPNAPAGEVHLIAYNWESEATIRCTIEVTFD